MVTAPTFYNLKDQGIYSAGDFFIPQEKYRAAPYTVNKPTNPDEVPAGIPAVYQAQGGDGFNPYNTNMSNIRQDYNPFPSRQAGEIYSKTFNPGPNPYLTNMFDELGSLTRAQSQYNLADQNISLTGPMTPERRAEIMRDADNIIQDNRMRYATEGQFVDPYDPRYSSMTEAQKFMDNYPDYYGVPSGVPEEGIPGAIKSYMQNSLLGKGVGMVTDFIGGLMPINERAIMENEARGAGIFTDDIGRIVTDDYNTAGGIMAGYNLNQINESTFNKRRSTIEKTIADKKSKGLDTTALEERLDLLDEAEKNILGARKKTQQIYKMRADKKAADKARKEAEKAAAAAAAAQADANRRADIQRIQSSLDSGGYDSTSSRPDRDRGSVTAASAAASKGVGGGGYTASDSTRDSYRGRYMMGGIADMLEIYD